MAQASIRLILPRAELYRRTQFQLMRPLRIRHASSTPKPRVLDKPTKFNPPSHGQKLPRGAPRQYPGPPLSAPEIAKQKTRKYPSMMPPEGSFMHWFLTDRSIHVWITLSTLFALAFYTFIQDFMRTTAFAHLLPPANTFLSHPIDWIGQYIHVYKLHTLRISEETAEKRRKKLEDVQKRSQYRKSHGLDMEQGFGGWMAKSDDVLEAALNTGGAGAGEGDDASPTRADDASSTEGDARVYADWEGRRRPIKKWLGIW